MVMYFSQRSGSEYYPPSEIGRDDGQSEVTIRRVDGKCPQLDTKTGNSYNSMTAAAKAVAPEYGLDQNDPFVWYKIIKVDPTRFKNA